MRRLSLAATTAAFTIAVCIAIPAQAQPVAAQPATIIKPALVVPVGQLPDAVKPSNYRLDLTVDPNKDRFSGHVEIEAAMKAASDTVFLHGNDLAMTRAVATSGGKQFVGS